jgi:hypothetical protein
MTEAIKIELPNGETAEAIACWFTLNANQQFVVLGFVNADMPPVEFNSPLPGIEATHMGRLREQSWIFEIRTVSSLRAQGWEFDLFPDPQIILLTDNR